MTTENSAKKKLMVGKVVSDKMNKTVVVSVERSFTDKYVHKTMRKTITYKVHDEQERAKIGDYVEIFEGRPISKTKYMYLNKVLSSES